MTDNWIRVTPETMPEARVNVILWHGPAKCWARGWLTDWEDMSGSGLAWQTSRGYHLVSDNVITHWQPGPSEPEELKGDKC